MTDLGPTLTTPALSPPTLAPPTHLTVIAVRHGSTELTGDVLNGCGAGAADPDLCGAGIAQAQRLCEQLDAMGWLERVHLAFSSTAQRAAQTANILTGAKSTTNTATLRDPRLCEVDFGRWEGRSARHFRQEAPELVSRWHADPTFAPPGGESLAQAAERVRSWRGDVLADAAVGEQRVVLAVAHASTVRVLVADALGLSLDNSSRLTVGPGAGAVVNFWSDGGSSLEALLPG